ncbi:MAG: nucleoside monophosphate kinase [Minisyncoccota bacterium]
MEMTRTVFFIGKPGCGKGTQTKLLAEKTGWKVMSAGDALRAMAALDTPVGRKMKSQMNAGLLMPSWLPTYLFLKDIFSLPDGASVILDGFNRKKHEAEIIRESLAWLERPFAVIYLRVSDEEIRRRLALRKEIEDRADDHAVDERLKEYYSHTEPVVEMFREVGDLIELDGEQSPERIAAGINAALGIK